MTVSEIDDALAAGLADELLEMLYGEHTEARARMSMLAHGFEEHFGSRTDIKLFSAPGRTELGGNHTDHQGGCVLAAAVSADAAAAAAPEEDFVARIYSRGFGAAELDLRDTEVRPEENGSFSALVRGLCDTFKRSGCPLGGFSAYIDSGVPAGSGLSSSAAFEVLIGSILRGLFAPGQVSDVELAFFGQRAENLYFGKPSGLMDQLAAAVGGIIAVDFGDAERPKIENIRYDFNQSGHSLVIIESGADHSALTPDYAMIPDEMCAVAEELGGEILSQTSELEFYATAPLLRRKLGERPVLRAAHYFSETRRAAEEAEALKSGDFEAFLELVNASARSSEEDLQNVTSPREPQNLLKKAIDTARTLLDGRGAARVHGGGFAGTAQAFVPTDMLPSFIENMRAAGFKCKQLEIRPVGGVEIMEEN